MNRCQHWRDGKPPSSQPPEYPKVLLIHPCAPQREASLPIFDNWGLQLRRIEGAPLSEVRQEFREAGFRWTHDGRVYAVVVRDEAEESLVEQEAFERCYYGIASLSWRKLFLLTGWTMLDFNLPARLVDVARVIRDTRPRVRRQVVEVRDLVAA